MASIPEHIKNLLFEQDCVVVPDFGGFITNFHGAVVREQDASMLPPRKRVAFNEVLKFDDGLLTSYIALKEGRSREEVRSRIRLFAEQAWRELRQRNRFRFEHLGSFTLNAEGKLVFEPDHRINFFGESYGMTAVALRYQRTNAVVALIPAVASRMEPVRERILEVVPEEVVTEVEEVVVPLNSRQRWLTLSNVAASTGIVLLSLVGWIWFDGGNSTLSSLNPVAMLKFSEWKRTPVAPAVTAKPFLEPKRSATEPVPAAIQATATLETKPIATVTAPVVYAKTSTASREAMRNVLVIPMRIRMAPGEISTAPGRYFVVVGGFGKAVNAQRLQRKLQAQGFAQASLLYPVKSRLVRVAAQEFDSVQEAQQAAAASRSVLGDHVWVLKTK